MASPSKTKASVKSIFETMIKYLGAKPSTEKRQEKRMEQKTGDIQTLLKAGKKVVKRLTTAKYTITAILYTAEESQATKKKKKKGEYRRGTVLPTNVKRFYCQSSDKFSR